MNRLCLIGALAVVPLFQGCETYKHHCESTQAHKNGAVPAGEAVVYLDQGWDASQQSCFYETSQGSQLIRYSWAVALERPGDSKLFLSDESIEELRFLPRGFDGSKPDQADRLPIGFVKDEEEDWLGFTCAACHTSQLEYRGKKLRVDGAGSLGDMVQLLNRLTASVDETLKHDDKLARFVNRVLGENHTQAGAEGLAKDLADYLSLRKDYDRRNAADIRGGNGRLDAFGRIFNSSLWHTEAGSDNFNPPDAPVSYPFLWGTDQSDFVQWVGFASNANIGPLARNAGEVLGVFGSVSLDKQRFPKLGYASSVRMDNLIQLEAWVRNLQAPVWPEDVFGPIDLAKATRGATLYQKHCARCHNLVERTDIDRKVVAWMENLDSIGTDPRTARNIVDRSGKTGILKGRKAKYVAGDRFQDVARVSNITGNLVIGLLASDLKADLITEHTSAEEGRGGLGPKKQGNYWPDNPLNNEPSASLLAYKGRSLTGAWATPPFLHNGSVPSLYQLLTPAEQRVKSFPLGSREFDPVNLGFSLNQTNPQFTFRVKDASGKPIPGNSNAGHSGAGFGTDLDEADKWALIEFMKTEMSPQ